MSQQKALIQPCANSKGRRKRLVLHWSYGTYAGITSHAVKTNERRCYKTDVSSWFSYSPLIKIGGRDAGFINKYHQSYTIWRDGWAGITHSRLVWSLREKGVACVSGFGGDKVKVGVKSAVTHCPGGCRGTEYVVTCDIWYVWFWLYMWLLNIRIWKWRIWERAD